MRPSQNNCADVNLENGACGHFADLQPLYPPNWKKHLRIACDLGQAVMGIAKTQPANRPLSIA